MRKLLFILILLITNKVIGQEFQGIATYRSSQQVTIKIDSSNVNQERAKEINEMIKSQFDNEYKLQFNRNESLYSVEEKLKLEGPQVSAAEIIVVGHPGQAPLYKNTATGVYAKEEDLMGKRFLVKDELKKPDWKIEPEQKKIGNYTVYKATWTRDVEIGHWDKEKGITKETVSRTAVAWYTPEIPVSHGPQNYWGLPGLIMEIQDDKLSLLCTGIVLNPKEKFEIQIPSKGKQIDQNSFNKIREEKNLEMREQMTKGGENGKTIKIRQQ